MVSTRSKAGISKQVEARSKGIAVNKVDLTAILEGRAKMQQEFADFKKQSSKQVEARSKGIAVNKVDLTAILEGQAKMQQEFADFKKQSSNETEALKQESSHLRRKIEMDATQKGKEKEVQADSKTLVFQPTEEESEYNPTLHTLSTTHHTPTLPTNHIPPHYHTTTFPTTICHPISAHPHKRYHPFINGIMETPLPT